MITPDGTQPPAQKWIQTEPEDERQVGKGLCFQYENSHDIQAHTRGR